MGDLNHKHLNNKLLLTGIQMSGIQMAVQYSDHHLNTGQHIVRYSNGIQILNHLAIGQLSNVQTPDWIHIVPNINIGKSLPFENQTFLNLTFRKSNF